MTAYITALPPADFPWRYAVEFDYSPEMVAALKQHIPPRLRKWCPERKQWWVREGQIEAVCTLAMAYCGGYVLPSPDAPARPELASVYAALHLLPTAPPALVKAAYKVLAKETHPDHGGDVRHMQAINAAYQALCGAQEGY